MTAGVRSRRRTRRARHLADACSSLGGDPVVRGEPTVVNGGRLDVGADLWLSSEPVPSHVIVGPGGTVVIGDRVRIGFGASISCEQRIEIGDDTTIGPYLALADSDFHVVGDRDARPTPRPVVVGRRVRIGSRVTILAGATIGDDVVVESSSVVGGHVPAGSHVAGVPARPVATSIAAGATTSDAVLDILRRTLALDVTPARHVRRDDVPAWDSLGALRILLALEEELGVRLGDQQVLGAADVGALVDATVAAVEAPDGPGDARRSDGDRHAAVGHAVRDALALQAVPAATADRDGIPGWDSLGALKILLTIEDRLDVSLQEADVAGARSIADLCAVVDRAAG